MWTKSDKEDLIVFVVWVCYFISVLGVGMHLEPESTGGQTPKWVLGLLIFGTGLFVAELAHAREADDES